MEFFVISKNNYYFNEHYYICELFYFVQLLTPTPSFIDYYRCTPLPIVRIWTNINFVFHIFKNYDFYVYKEPEYFTVISYLS